MAQAQAVPGNSGRADYPRMLYHADGRTMVAETPEEHDRLARAGWEQLPLPIHQQRPATASPVLSGSDPLALMIAEVVETVIERVLDRRGIGKRKGAD